MTVSRPRYNVTRHPLHFRASEQLYELIPADRRGGPDRLRWPPRRALVEVRCPRGHMTARVYGTPEGPLFVSWPEPPKEQRGEREGPYRLNQRGGNQEIADLLEVEPDSPEHPDLLGWCRCGQMRLIDRDTLRTVVRAVSTGERTKRDVIL